MDLRVAREAVEAAYFADEATTVRERLGQVHLDRAARDRIEGHAADLVTTLRADPSADLMESFLAEYGLSTDEGVALMCLAEAYLRVPDAPTLDALIRDKIGGADWSKHLGSKHSGSRHSGDAESLLINASTWALMLTGHLYREDPPLERRVLGDLRRLVQRAGEPVVRAAVAQAMKVMGQQFVLGRDIAEAIENGAPRRAQGYRYSFDMLGEAARTEADARRYFRAYANAISALSPDTLHGTAHDNPGISVKLSALHPRYEPVQRDRVMDELVPRLAALVEQARNSNLAFNIDAEEADRLGLSLTVIEEVLKNRDLAGWDGFGVVVQAYAKQCLPTLRWVRTLAEQLGRKLAVRLVKGAYWDTEIKHSQLLGLETYPVFTRKASTDVSYLAGARYLLANAEWIYPQFATHNAHSVAAVLEMAGEFTDFEFQRLHGMGEGLHELVRQRSGRRCRIYAPVGVHQDLLAYLVRRLLENGANSSFVNQLLDHEVSVPTLVRDPIAVTESLDLLAHPLIARPPMLFGAERRNARGWNLDNPVHARALDTAMEPYRHHEWHAQPQMANHLAEPAANHGCGPSQPGDDQPRADHLAVHNPALPADRVGAVRMADAQAAHAALTVALGAFPAWRDTKVEQRADVLDAIADQLEANTPELMALLTREAGKTRLDGVLEVREAVDFCRFYAAQARRELAHGARSGRGPFVCISPWNFPLAIYTGQIAAALVAGNTVVAKPAEQTSLIGHRVYELMRQAGVPAAVLSFLPGDGATVGAALTADPRVAGICFTGSTETAVLIDRAMANAGHPRAPLIAETGGINAMIVDSTALPEAAVRDIVASAFQSAGQRCSALRALFVQRDIAADLLEMLAGATEELVIGNPWDPAVDVGPVIDDDACRRIEAHCAKFADRGATLFRHRAASVPGRFVPPTAIRLGALDELDGEIFGPVLHVIEVDGDEIENVIDAINASGYGLTLGIHSRLDDRVDALCGRAEVGNIYVNRNQIGAVVGVQPFGGEKLSGTGPKAGGPHYLARFTRPSAPAVQIQSIDSIGSAKRGAAAPVSLSRFVERALPAQPIWDLRADRGELLERVAGALPDLFRPAARAALDAAVPFLQAADPLPGPTGESNYLTLHGRGIALCLGGDGGAPTLLAQALLALAAGNAVALAGADAAFVAGTVGNSLARAGAQRGLIAALGETDPDEIIAGLRELGVVLFDSDDTSAAQVRQALSQREGRRVPLICLAEGLEVLATERVVSIDTTASGGNTSLLTLSE